MFASDILLLFLTSSALLWMPALPLQFSCAQAKNINTGTNAFCSEVGWFAAAAFNTSSSTLAYYTSKGNAMDTSAQDAYANKLYDSLREINSMSPSYNSGSMCSDAMHRFSCVSAFPLCPISTSTPEVAYFMPCQLQCLQVQTVCGLSSM
jgi:hypothetical protein